ncbi:hypothetical protein EVAR_72475_1 [Eumeta japonica]|uniref:Uncharacterized protein n=1 Tax=Eumeta variegata TaxID=151549 RepID=A0A4C1T7S6_EUMVA|nr:hypothetical protein EVAR_72475_1 [Eumeta japonica]
MEKSVPQLSSQELRSPSQGLIRYQKAWKHCIILVCVRLLEIAVPWQVKQAIKQGQVQKLVDKGNQRIPTCPDICSQTIDHGEGHITVRQMLSTDDHAIWNASIVFEGNIRNML